MTDPLSSLFTADPLPQNRYAITVNVKTCKPPRLKSSFKSFSLTPVFASSQLPFQLTYYTRTYTESLKRHR